MRRGFRRFRWLLLGATLVALVITSSAGATPFDFQQGQVNTIPTPFIIDGLQAGALFSATNHNTVASSGGIIGRGDGAGWGVDGESTSGYGVMGLTAGANSSAVFANNTGSGWGVLAQTASLARPAIRGVHPGSTGFGPGTEGETFSTADFASGVQGIVGFSGAGAGAAGVKGQNKSTGANGYGVWGENQGANSGVLGTSVNEVGVWGEHEASTGTNAGVEGKTLSTADLASGVYGENTGSSGLATGVYGNAPSGIGLLGVGGNVAVLGYNPNAGGIAGYFAGDAVVSGTLYKGAGAFRIDHPLDPAHKYLQHSFVESPQMMNVYNGNVTTDGKGFATVKLPAYFQALNRSFRYQLTVIDKRHWMARAAIWDKIEDNRFTIRTDQSHVQVSWQVTGVRHDAYANAHRIPVVLEKAAKEQGKYLHPELYGKRRSSSVLTVPAKVTRAKGR